MSEELKQSALDFLKKAKEAVSEVTEKAVSELEKSGALDEIKKTQDTVKSYMDEKGITEKAEQGISKAKELSDVAGDHLDQVSGKKILETVERRLQVQTEYNDLLATKLEEALQRIEQLEIKIGTK